MSKRLFYCADAVPRIARTVYPTNPLVECRDGKLRRRFGRGLRSLSEPHTLEKLAEKPSKEIEK